MSVAASRRRATACTTGTRRWPLTVQITPRTSPNDDHRADAEAEHVQGEQEHARDPDRDGHADALDDGLHGQAVLDRDDLVRGVDRRAGRSVGRRDVGDAEDAGEHEEAERGSPRPRGDDDHDREHARRRRRG